MPDLAGVSWAGCYGHLEFDDDGVRLAARLKTQGLDWDDVGCLEIGGWDYGEQSRVQVAGAVGNAVFGDAGSEWAAEKVKRGRRRIDDDESAELVERLEAIGFPAMNRLPVITVSDGSGKRRLFSKGHHSWHAAHALARAAISRDVETQIGAWHG